MSRNIAVISGASGFLGQRLIRVLESKQIETVTLSRDLYYSPVQLTKFLEKIQPLYIFHTAAYGNMASHTDPAKMIEANIIGTMNLINASKNVKYKAFINVSTSSVTLPRETFYSATKASAEHLCKAFQLEFNKPVISVRPYSLYGIGEASNRFIPTVFASCLNGTPMNLATNGYHDWTYVDDFAQSLLIASDNTFIFSDKPYGFGTGKATGNAKVVELIEKLTGKKANIESYGAMRSFDTKDWKASGDDFITNTDLKTGLKLYYESIQ